MEGYLYSELILARRNNVNMEEIILKVQSGTKVILLTDGELKWFDRSTAKLVEESMLYQVHIDPEYPFTSIAHSIKNGLDFCSIRSNIQENFPTFNREQYQVEHANSEGSIIISAGAGSGKTTVIIQRILFLMKHVKVEPSELAMITFTREAAKNMYEKLSEALYLRFKITRRNEYLKDIEKINDLQISTIDSFLHRLFRQLGGEFGFSPGFSIRNYKRERRELIESAINSFMSDYQNKHGQSNEFIHILNEIRDYELINLIDEFWKEFEKRGVPIKSKESMQRLFGEVDHVHEHLQEMIITTITSCNEAFNEEQINENAVTLSYLSNQLDQLLEDNPDVFQQIILPYKYLFIDEFQDSSDFQIRLSHQLAVQHHIKLFVVGDVKQSIYRFRGADESAFEKLLKLDSTGMNWIPTVSLQQNYRTSKGLLDILDQKYFSNWGGNFTYTDNDRLFSIKPKARNATPLIIEPINYEKKEECRNIIVNWVRQTLRQMEGQDPKKHRVAVLTRTRKEARIVAEWLSTEQIPFYLDLGGTLFESQAARDLNRLVHALLFSYDLTYACEYLMTPYSAIQLDPSLLIEANGNTEKIKTVIYPFILRLQYYQNEARKLPIISLLRMIIKDSEVVNRYYEILIQRGSPPEEAERKALAYDMNLSRIMDLIVENRQGDYLSLPSLLKWIQIQLKSNREDDEPKDDSLTNGAVNILTIHRAKGLEYHTVMIPFTDRYFYTSVNYHSGIIFNSDRSRAGWKIRLNSKSDDKNYSNSTFNRLQNSEENAIEAEELRLLYVAMTRAQEQLWIVKCTNRLGKACWAKYLTVIGAEF